MAHTKKRMAREIKRAGQIERTGFVQVVSDDLPANDGGFSDDDWLADVARDTDGARRDVQLNGSGVLS